MLNNNKKQETLFFGTKCGNANSIAAGYATETTNYGEIATGILNKSTKGDNPNSPEGVVGDPKATLFSVGCGTKGKRKNALEVKGDGSVIISGKDGSDVNIADLAEKLDLPSVDLSEYVNKNELAATESAIQKQIATKANAQDVTNAIGELQDKIGDRVVVSGNVTNNPDEEDITTEGDTPLTQVLKLKDRAYDSLNASGKGYKILRKNWQTINGERKNVLTQDMINEPNTIYEIRYDFDLNNEEIEIKEGCILKFNGGSLNNGRLNGNKLDTNYEYDAKLFSGNKISQEGVQNALNICKNLCILDDLTVRVNKEFKFTIFDVYTAFIIPPNTNIKINSTITAIVPDEYNNLRNKVIASNESKNISISGTGNIIIKDNLSEGKSTAIYFNNFNNILIDGISLSGNGQYGICITGVNSYNSVIKNMIISDFNQLGVAITDGNNITIDNCIIRNIIGTVSQYGIDIEPNNGVDNVVIKNCSIYNNGVGSITLTNPSNIIIKNCILDGQLNIGKCETAKLIGCDAGFGNINQFTSIELCNFNDLLLRTIDSSTNNNENIISNSKINSIHSENHSNLEIFTFNNCSINIINNGHFRIVNSVRTKFCNCTILIKNSSMNLQNSEFINCNFRYNIIMTSTENIFRNCTFIQLDTNKFSSVQSDNSYFYNCYVYLSNSNKVFISNSSKLAYLYNCSIYNGKIATSNTVKDFGSIIIKNAEAINNYSYRGNSENKPSLSEASIGFRYFDTSLNKPIYWNGTKWIEPIVTTDLDPIYTIIYNQHASVSLSSNVSGNIIEKGVDTSVTLNWNYIFNGATTVPDSLQLKSGDSVLVSDKSTKTLTETISDSKSYQAIAVMKGVTKTANLTINAYYPIYYGGSNKTTLVSADILAMTKHSSIKANAVGNYSFSVGEGEYAWICVPAGMTITKVTSGGFEVPMEPAVVVQVEGKGSYNCYRSSNTFKAGTFNCTVQ